MKYIVELEENLWIAPWEGDPGRTSNINSAKRFAGISKAMDALEQARKYRPFLNAIIVADLEEEIA